MGRDLHNLKFILSLTKTYLRNNPYYTIIWLFVRYASLRLERLKSLRTPIKSVPDVIIAKFIKNHHEEWSKNYVDFECCALGQGLGLHFGNWRHEIDYKKNEVPPPLPNWHYLCSSISGKKYRFFIEPYKNFENCRRQIIMSETMRFNMANFLGHSLDDDRSYFLLPVVRKDEISQIATEARISMISNCHHDCSNHLIDVLLNTYFSTPRYTQRKSIFCINVKKYAPDYFYSSSARIHCLRKIYFRVEYLGVRCNNIIKSSTKQACYILKGQTRLVQLPNIFAYVTPEYGQVFDIDDAHAYGCQMMPMDLENDTSLIGNCPPVLEKPLSSLVDCLAPFLHKDIETTMRPVFLVKGAPGSGKFKLIECLAKRNGLNLLNVDFSEIQCSSAAQTEAKLRIILQNARNSLPCILRLSNIQIFGKNSEGKKDERIVSTFGYELEKLKEKATTEYPLIVIATLENDELEADMERLFIDTVCIEHPNQSERADTLLWLLKSKGFDYRGNLMTIAALVSDFRFADLEALLMQTVKIAYETRPTEIQAAVNLTLMDIDFAQACDIMEASFTDRVGAPRIPKVYWEDIGGLASLKHEIKRRIELPMLNKMGLGKSGLILYGPPGTGKTLLAKAVATECQLHFMSVKGPELLNMYVGQSEKNVRQVFERARAVAPCVIFFDELDSLAPNRGRSGDSGGVMDRVVSQLLAEMDGLESCPNIFIIAATNRLDLIDGALLRPGRFDKMLYVGIYDDRDSQLSVLRAVTRRFRMKNKGDELNKIVDILPKNLTGADLYALCSDAWLLAVARYFQTLDNSNDQTQNPNNNNNNNKVIAVVDNNNFQDEIIIEYNDFVEAARNLVPSLSATELARYEKNKKKVKTKLTWKDILHQ